MAININMDFDSDEWHKLQEEHLSFLTQYGIEYTSSVQAAVALLEADFEGKIELSEYEKRTLFVGLTEAAKKHSNLIKWALSERKNYINREL